MRWGDFEQVAPDIAGSARAAFERFGLVLAGTVRRDGTPRISPVEAHLVHGRLMLVLIAGSRKVDDLDRDPRLVLKTPVTDAENPGREVVLRGRVTDADAPQRRATAAAVEAASGWRPRDSWRFLDLDLDAASCVEWQGDEMTLRRWDRAKGTRPVERRRLDMAESRYVPVADSRPPSATSGGGAG